MRSLPDPDEKFRAGIRLGTVPPADLSGRHYLATDTRTPGLATVDESGANQTAHLIGRWISTRGGAGPLSETLGATVPG